MDYYHYTIPGNPIPLKRARSSRGRWYDPQCVEKRKLQDYLKIALKAVCVRSKPISIELEFHMPIPASWSKKKQAAAIGQPHIVKPDLDNLAKMYGDLGNNILWDDDCLIYKLTCCKIYSDNPRTEIKISV